MSAGWQQLRMCACDTGLRANKAPLISLVPCPKYEQKLEAHTQCPTCSAELLMARFCPVALAQMTYARSSSTLQPCSSLDQGCWACVASAHMQHKCCAFLL